MAPELLPGPGVQCGWEAYVRLSGFADGSHGCEGWQYRKWHRDIRLLGRQGCAGTLHSHRAPTALDRQETRRWSESSTSHGDSISRRADRDRRSEEHTSELQSLR